MSWELCAWGHGRGEACRSWARLKRGQLLQVRSSFLLSSPQGYYCIFFSSFSLSAFLCRWSWQEQGSQDMPCALTPDLEAARGEQGEPPVMTCGRRPLLLLSLQGPATAGTPFWHCRRRALAQFSSEGRKPKRQLRARGSGGASHDRHRAQRRAVGADGKQQRRLLASIPCKYPAPQGPRPRPPGAAGTRIALVLN